MLRPLGYACQAIPSGLRLGMLLRPLGYAWRGHASILLVPLFIAHIRQKNITWLRAGGDKLKPRTNRNHSPESFALISLNSTFNVTPLFLPASSDGPGGDIPYKP